MKTKIKIWSRVLLVCMIMSLSCVNAHSADENKVIIEKETTEKKEVAEQMEIAEKKKTAEQMEIAEKKETAEQKNKKRRKMNQLEIFILLKNEQLR